MGTHKFKQYRQLHKLSFIKTFPPFATILTLKTTETINQVCMNLLK